MKNATRILVTLLVLICFQANAQASLGLQVGGGMFNLQVKNAAGNEIEDYNLAPRFNVGIIAEFPLGPTMGFQSGLLYATKGSTYKDETPPPVVTNFFMNYLEIPANLVYKAITAQGTFFVGGGAYLGYGLNGRIKQKIGDTEYDRDLRFANEWPADLHAGVAFKRIDYGINALAGYQHSTGIFVSLNAQMGLANLFVEPPLPAVKLMAEKSIENKSSRKNIGFSLNLGFKF